MHQIYPVFLYSNLYIRTSVYKPRGMIRQAEQTTDIAIDGPADQAARDEPHRLLTECKPRKASLAPDLAHRNKSYTMWPGIPAELGCTSISSNSDSTTFEYLFQLCLEQCSYLKSCGIACCAQTARQSYDNNPTYPLLARGSGS